MLQPDNAYSLTDEERRLLKLETRVSELERMICLFRQSTVETLEVTSDRLRRVDSNIQAITGLLHGGGK